MTPTELFTTCGEKALANASSDSVRKGARAYLVALAKAATLTPTLRTVPVVDEVRAQWPTVSNLRWVPSPRGEDTEGRHIALCPFNAHLDLGEVTAGLMVVGAGQIYPEHDHPPQELYYVLSGAASWRFGGHEHYEEVVPGATFYNPPGVRHSARAKADEPVLAFYALWP